LQITSYDNIFSTLKERCVCAVNIDQRSDFRSTLQKH